jgi:hypothetical protein
LGFHDFEIKFHFISYASLELHINSYIKDTQFVSICNGTGNNNVMGFEVTYTKPRWLTWVGCILGFFAIEFAICTLPPQKKKKKEKRKKYGN